MLTEFEFSLGKPSSHSSNRGRKLLRIVQHHKAFHPRSRDQELEIIRRAGRSLCCVVLTNRSADYDSSPQRKTGQTRIKNFPTHVIKINIDSVRAVLLQSFCNRFVLIINTCVKPELVDHCTTLVSATGNSDHTTAEDLGNLPDDRSNSSCGGRHNYGLPRLGLTHLEQTKVCGHARRSKSPQIGRQRSQPGIDFEETLGRTDIL